MAPMAPGANNTRAVGETPGGGAVVMNRLKGAFLWRA